MNPEQKIEHIVKCTSRMRKDSIRLSQFLDQMLEKPYNLNSIEGLGLFLSDLDHGLAEILAMTAFLNLIRMEIYSGEYPTELFELTPVSRSEFLAQVSNLLSYYKSMSYVIIERSKIARSALEYCISQEKLSLMKKQERGD